MSLLIEPDEEEKYLYAILSDESGLDIAEFLWEDEESESGRYRAWPFQWEMYSCEDMYQVEQGARALGKTVGITMRAFAFAFNYPGQHLLLTAPELNHLKPLTAKIEERLDRYWLTMEMRPRGRSRGVMRSPHWECTFLNDAKIVSRLPQRDGKGVKGQHVIKIELDEAQDYPLAGWIEIVETLNRGLPGASWRCHGVPRGVRDRFYEITMNENTEWTVHRPMAMQKVTWTSAERDEKTIIYGGSRQSPDYKRNIYGEHGDASSPLFVLARLMASVDKDSGSEYNTDVYLHASINAEDVPEDSSILNHLYIPGTHKHGWSGAPKGYSAYYAGMDVGVTNHPSEILVFGQRAGGAKEHLDLLLRVHLQRIPVLQQQEVIEHLFASYGPKLQTFGIDRTGVGFPLWQALEGRYRDRMKGYNFSAKYVIGFEDRPLEKGETQEDLKIERNIVEFSSDALREIVDAKGLTLPFDGELLQEWQGQNYTVVKSAGNPYGKKNFSAGKYHTLDAGKMAIAAKRLSAIDAMLNAKTVSRPVLDQFIGSF